MTSRELTALMEKSPVSCHKALVKEYGRYVYAIAYNKLRGCGTNEDIEECVSDVFAALFMQCEYDLSMSAVAVRQRCSRAMDKLRAKLLEIGITL